MAIVLTLVYSAIVVPSILAVSSLAAQESASGDRPPQQRYSHEVVAKADEFLQQAGLRRSGKTIQATLTAPIARAITSLTREKRELRLLQQDWNGVADQISAIGQELRRINAQDVELNLQLAQVAGKDVTANNRIVGLINANRGRGNALRDQRQMLQQELAMKRSLLNDAEAQYAETVLAIRKDYQAIADAIDQSLADPKVKIAVGVMHTNYASPAKLTAAEILASLDRRIGKLESEVFAESIPLQSVQGSLLADVAVGRKTARMVIDSGAELITLPMKTATELGIKIPLDAPSVTLILANGDRIPARRVTLPRVRIGQFEAEQIDAAVLDAAANQAEPLLGMSFLSHFKFEIDVSEKTLKLLRIASE